MTASQREVVDALARARLSPGTAMKRFVQDMASRPAEFTMSERGEAFLWRIAYHCRRQLPRAMADEAIARKRDHRIEADFGGGWFYCGVCQQRLPKRSLNAGCSGPPAERRKVVMEKKVVDGAVEFEVSVQGGLF